MLPRNPKTAFTTLVLAGGLSLAHAGNFTYKNASEPPSTLAKSTLGKSYEQCCAKAQSRWGRWRLDRPFPTGDFGENGHDVPISRAVRKVLTRLSLRPAETGNTYPGLHLGWTPPPFDAAPLSPRLSDTASTSTAPFEPIKKKGLRWLPAISQSLFFTGIQLAIRMKEEETRGRVAGPFFQGWFESAGSLFEGGWSDGGRDFTNYVAHPASGSVWGYIYRHNHRSEQTLEIAWNRSYVSHLAKSMLWSFAWGLQFEIGPFSESSLGSVYEPCAWCSRSVAWVDIVVTPVVGVGVLSLGEDALDRWVIKKLELRTNKVGRGALRVLLNPTRSVAMLMALKKPWHRDDR